jgi:anti-anti-sigma factor
MTGLRITEDDVDGVAVLAIEGEIDAGTVGTVREALAKAASRVAPRLVVDVRNVSYIDSLGFTVLTQAVKTARDNRGRMSVLCDDRLANLFATLGLADELAVSRSPDEAVERAATVQLDISAFANVEDSREAMRHARGVVEQGSLPPDDDELLRLQEALARYTES